MHTSKKAPHRTTALLGTALALVAAACDNGTTGPDAAALTTAEAALLADQIDASSGDIVDGRSSQLSTSSASAGELGIQSTTTTTITFEATRTCPASGSITVEGTMVRERNPDTRTATIHTEATRTMSACARAGERGTITVDGELTLTADRKFVDGKPSGPQTTTHKGSITWTRDSGESRSCEVDITSIRDPEAHTRSVTGTVCGREVSRTVTWSRT